MKRLPLLLISLCILAFSCSKENDPVVVPAHTITSDRGLIIELEWNTGGSTSQALNEADLDLYLDLGDTPVEASENFYHFESVQLKDIYRDGTYSIYIGSIAVSRRTNYNLYISAPGDQVVHKYEGVLMPGETGEIHYLNIRKNGPRYTLLD